MEENVVITKNKVISSLIWKFLERGGVQGIQFVLSIIIARLVTPADYGTVAILLVFIQIANVFIQTGFSTALIQKKESDNIDYSSILYLSLFISAIIYCVIFFLAPIFADFYSQSELVTLLRVLSISLFFGAINSVQGAYVAKTMQFRRFFFSSLGAAIGSGILGIVIAYLGYGVWALVVQQLFNVVFTCVILWFTVNWRPQLVFSINRVKSLFSFGWKLLFSALLDTIFRNVYNLIIGKVYSSEMLGVFNRGQQFPQYIETNINSSIQSVMLPTLSNQKSLDDVKRIMRLSISLTSYILIPCLFGLAVVSKPLVILLLTDKWVSCVPYMQLSCIAFSLYPIHGANLTAINSIGRSDVYLKLEIIKKIVMVLVLLVTIKQGIFVMAVGQCILSFLSSFINAFPSKRLLNYSYFEQIKDILPSVGISSLMCAIIYPISLIPIKDIYILVIQIVLGISIYIGLSIIFKPSSFIYITKTINEIRSK